LGARTYKGLSEAIKIAFEEVDEQDLWIGLPTAVIVPPET
jgi:hypothetical protein